MAIAFERELKGLLGGEPEIVADVSRALPSDQAKALEKVCARPFLVVRAAGSLGCDLVALRDDFSFPIEVKSATKEIVHLSNTRQMKEQARAMQEACARAGVIALYAFRKKRNRGDDAWRLFAIPADGFTGRTRVLYDRIPKLATTDQGNFVMRWREGMPLHSLIDYLC